MKPNYLFVFPLIVSILFILMGGAMIAKGLVAHGVNSRTLMKTGFDGFYLMFFGIIFLLIIYFSLSPFSRIRNFNFNFFQREKNKKKDIKNKN